MPKILVVDDDVFVGLLISLELPDVVVVEAARISEGFQQAVVSQPDAIVVDRGLPDGDGLELVRSLRRNRATSRTPILVLTAGHDEAHREQVTKAGADDYMAKPFDPVDLLGRLERVLRLPPADRKPRRAAILNRVRDGLPADYDLGQAPAVIDLTEDDDDARVGGGFLGRWRSRRGG